MRVIGDPLPPPPPSLLVHPPRLLLFIWVLYIIYHCVFCTAITYMVGLWIIISFRPTISTMSCILFNDANLSVLVICRQIICYMVYLYRNERLNHNRTGDIWELSHISYSYVISRRCCHNVHLKLIVIAAKRSIVECLNVLFVREERGLGWV